MKPFDIEQALAGAPICTRGNGSRIYDLTRFERARQPHKLVGVTWYGDILSWTDEGKFGVIDPIPEMDLVMWEEGDKLCGGDDE